MGKTLGMIQEPFYAFVTEKSCMSLPGYSVSTDLFSYPKM